MTEEVKQEENVGISLQDIANCVNVIDICSKRGAFEGVELEGIGALRGRLAKFVEANQPPAEEENAEDASK